LPYWPLKVSSNTPVLSRPNFYRDFTETSYHSLVKNHILKLEAYQSARVFKKNLKNGDRNVHMKNLQFKFSRFFLGVMAFSSQTSYSYDLLFVAVNPDSAAKERASVERVYGKDNVLFYENFIDLEKDLKDPAKSSNFHGVKSWVTSGHSTGFAFQTSGYGSDGNFYRGMQDMGVLKDAILAAQTRDPKIMAGVENVYGYGCYTANCNALRRWDGFRDNFPLLKNTAGFEKKGPSPMGETLIRGIRNYELDGNQAALQQEIVRSRTNYTNFKSEGGLQGTLTTARGVSEGHSIDYYDESKSREFIAAADEWLAKHGAGGSSFDSEFALNMMGRMASPKNTNPFPSKEQARAFYDDYVQNIPNIHPSLYGRDESGTPKPGTQLTGEAREPSGKQAELNEEKWLRLIYADNIAQSFLDAGRSSGLFDELKKSTNDPDTKEFLNNLAGDALAGEMSARDQVMKFTQSLDALPASYGRIGLKNFSEGFASPWDMENESINTAFPLELIDQRISPSGSTAGVYQNLEKVLDSYKPTGGSIPESDYLVTGWEAPDGLLARENSTTNTPAPYRAETAGTASH